MKKISLLKSLALLGAVGLTSACIIETALLINKKSGPEIDTTGSQTGDVINLNTYSGYTLAEEIKYDSEPSGSEIKDFLQNNGIQLTTEEPFKFSNINDLDVVVDSTTKTFSVIAKNNSPDYVDNSVALIHYATPTKIAIASIIGTAPTAYIDNKFEDEELTKSNILTSLKSSFPTLNINHLVLELNSTYAQEGSATVSAKQGSSLYVGDPIGITYNTSGSVTMTLDKNVIAQGQTATPTFKYHGTTPPTGVTYSCSAPSTNFAFSTTTGVLTYTSGNTADFLGGAYSINASYTNGSNTYIASQIVFAQSNIQTATVTISAPNINATNKNSGTTTFKVNGATVTTNLAYVLSPAVPAGQGLSFNATTGVLTWDGSTPTNGGIFTITGTNSGTGIKTAVGENKVYVTSALVATLTVANPIINNGTRNSGTATMKVNGTNKTVTTWAVTGGLTATANAQGLSFSTTGVITWNGSSMTDGGTYTITATYTATNGISVQATATVYVTPWGKKTGTVTIYGTYCDVTQDLHAYQVGRMCYLDGMIHLLDQGYSNYEWLKIEGIGAPDATTRTDMYCINENWTLYNGTFTGSGTTVHFAPWGGMQGVPTGWFVVNACWYTNN